MSVTSVVRPARSVKSRLRPSDKTNPAVPLPASRPAEGSADAGEFPSREALTTHLEAQRKTLLRAMACVSRAHRTLEKHLAKLSAAGEALSPGAKRQELYELRALEALGEAGQALATAYPMLQRIADAPDVVEILKEPAPVAVEGPAARRAGARKR